MEQLSRVKVALVVAALSLYVGLQIGFDRHWSAGVFVFLIPVAVLIVFVRTRKKEEPDPIERVTARLDVIEEKLDRVLSMLPTKANVRSDGVNKS